MCIYYPGVPIKLAHCKSISDSRCIDIETKKDIEEVFYFILLDSPVIGRVTATA